jgi:hypothetical protein
MKRRWTAKDIRFIKIHYISHGAKFCANKLNVTISRIRIKASRLKITKCSHDINFKVCRSCFIKKHISEFSPHKIAKMGVQSKCKKCRAKWESNRKQTDKDYRLLHTIRNRIRMAIKRNTKQGKSKDLLGCSIQFFKEYISKRFLDGMSWDNHGKWHIDHIRPCSSFDMSDKQQQQQCFHYTNLQPLWAKDNLSKGKRVI